MTSQPVGRRLVSVLVPAYNAAPTITQTLRSALDQSYPTIEVVVVDDGSQDETADIVQKVANADARVRLICQANQGVASARNAALRASRGNLIAPFDADDLWHRDKIARQVRRLDEGGVRVGVVYCWSSDIDGEGRIMAHRLDLNRYEGDVLAALVVTNFIDNASVPLIRRAELEAIGGWDSSLHARGAQGCEDWQLYLRLAQRCNFGLEPAFLVGYRQAPAAMSRNVRRMRKSYRLVMAEVRRSSPALPAKVHRWSQAEFDFYTASLLNQSSPVGRLFFFIRGILRDPVWLLRRSTRKKFRRWISGGLGRKGVAAVSGLRPSSKVGLPFGALAPEPDEEIPEGPWIARRRQWLSALGEDRGGGGASGH
jgi:glycosyltransferase involved in cell wall biosynthesis